MYRFKEKSHVWILYKIRYMNKHMKRFSTSLFIREVHIKTIMNQARVAHASNPSYSGGRDQENRSSKPAQENSS
jgi:hypothetical protein